MVELDYGGVVALLDDERLRDDDSVQLVGAALAGLSDGDPDVATGAYEQLVSRWRAVQLLERAN